MHRSTSWVWFVFIVALIALSSVSTVAAQSDSASPEGASEQVGELPAGSSDGQQIPVGGSVKLDHLGPTVVTEEGQIKRIQNWDKLTKQEQDTAWRRIQKRNTERLEALRQKGEEGDRHDSTLGGIDDDQKTAEQRAAKAGEHLKKFIAGLDKLKQHGQGVPGLDGLQDLLKDPRKEGNQEVDPKLLRERLEELRKNTEKLRKQGVLRDEL